VGQLCSQCEGETSITITSVGMFIFAELLAKYLQDQPTIEALLRELDPAKLPVKLNHV
jgi:hypothetical protein